MQYISTRDNSVRVSAAQAIAQGISRDSGLFVPETLPTLSRERLQSLVSKSYTGRAAIILGDFLSDFTADEVWNCVTGAYGEGFASDKVAPVVKLNADTYMLELWHGPTCAFKDMALQLLPHLLTRSAAKTAGEREIDILVATSGDTGKAALEGFRDVPGTRILVFYPQDGVSEVQRLQMATQEGANVGVCGVYGNFDDTQTAVKRIFTDTAMAEKLAAKNKQFSSANSINWGRLAPQIVYYVSAYCDLVQSGDIAMGEKINIAVPTGNFGNILAAYYAKHMGLPVHKLICASNINNVLSDFIATGTYDRRREFHLTASPSMDILISSNLERLLYALYDQDSAAISALMGKLSAKGVYTVSDTVKERLQAEFYGGYCDEQATAETIRETWVNFEYLLDTHTAVGLAVREQYLKASGDTTKTIVASTANPYKFSPKILAALRGTTSDADEFAQAEALSKLTRTQIPPQILALQNKTVRFEQALQKDEMAPWVCKMLEV